MISNGSIQQIGPSSYNFKLGSIFQYPKVEIKLNEEVKLKELELPIKLKPEETIMCRTKEKITMPKDITLLLFPKSSTLRHALQIMCGVVDPGYEGEIIFTLKNSGLMTIIIEKDDILLKGIFVNNEGKSSELLTEYQGGKLI